MAGPLLTLQLFPPDQSIFDCLIFHRSSASSPEVNGISAAASPLELVSEKLDVPDEPLPPGSISFVTY